MSGRPRTAGRCKPIQAWPEIDRRLREAALDGGDLIDGGGALSGYRAPTIRFLDKGNGRWLQWLDDIGELDPMQSPARRVTEDRIRRYVPDLLKLNCPKTVIGRLGGLYYMLRAIDPSHDVRCLRRAIASLRRRYGRSRAKDNRLVTIDDLFRLGVELMDTAGPSPYPQSDAVQFRTGLLIAMLAAFPMRTADIMALLIGTTLIQSGGQWWIDLPASKTAAPALFPVPPALGRRIDDYLARHRPWLLNGDGDRAPREDLGELWISAWGTPLSRIYDSVVEATRAKFGKPIGPHFFRHCFATTVAVEDPDHVGIIAPVLTHHDPRTGETYYNLARNHAAARRWQACMLALRR